jgi:3-oxoacyl-[acyl-carrier-protein] synthase II
MSDRRVVITGLGLVCPLGNDIESYWKALVEGRSGISRVERFDVEKHSSKIAGQVNGFDAATIISEREMEQYDRFIQFAIVASHSAVSDAGLEIDRIDSTRIGALIGSGIGGIGTIEQQTGIMIQRGPRRISPHFIPAVITNMASGITAMKLGLKGPNVSVATACATGNHSIGDAFKCIQRGSADMMLAGGTEAAVTPLGMAGFCSMRALSTRNDEPEKASRPFDKERDGFVMAEGSGIVVLEELEHAKKRGAEIYAEIVGYGATADAFHLTAPSPEGEGAQRAMAAALKDGGVNPEDVDYINAHGTSTPVGDVRETEAIKGYFKDHARQLAVSSTKSMVGHLLGAAGGVETVATALMLKRGIIHPTINQEVSDPECDLDYVPNEARESRVELALSNSLGFGGHNATLLFRRFS